LNRGRFEVQRLRQDWQAPSPSERRLLDLGPRQIALVREALLLLAGQPVVFARSVFPYASLTGSLAHLRRLQNRSLGAILFRHPGIHRSPFELARIDGRSDYLPQAQRQDAPAWGRRCRFETGGRGLLVTEVFLENFIPWSSLLPVHRTRRGPVSAAIVPPTK
jgi:chorismate--pyruvate lyase